MNFMWKWKRGERVSQNIILSMNWTAIVSGTRNKNRFFILCQVFFGDKRITFASVLNIKKYSARAKWRKKLMQFR